MLQSAAIFGCQGLELSEWEKAFFKEHQPWGFILFARNVESPEQVLRLTDEMRLISGRDHVPILVDQEGGRVQRLRQPHWPEYPSARCLGDIADTNTELASRAVWLMSRLHAFDLRSIGINVNCLPLLDVPVEGAHDVIGSRAYGTQVQRISVLGQAACDGLLAGGILPVVKHIPGHGRAQSDTHLALPIVETSRAELEITDFEPFKRLAHQRLAMTAHVVFSDIDSDSPATTSKIMINDIIRSFIGFEGLLMSDDLSMEALSGDFAQRTRACFDAGCDIVLHCNGDQGEMTAIAENLIPLEGKAADRAKLALNDLCQPDGSNESALRDEFDSIISGLE